MVGATNRGSMGTGSVTGNYFPPGGPSETDGETLDNFTDDLGEYDEWNYREYMEML